MWKLLSSVFASELYGYFEKRELLLIEQKGYQKKKEPENERSAVN